MHTLSTAVLMMLAFSAAPGPPTGRPLEQSLIEEDPRALAKAVRERGDAARGAAVFYLQYMTCVKCHSVEGGGVSRGALGPDLSALGKHVTDLYLIESVLKPSAVIKKGYETITVATTDGQTIVGLLDSETPDAIILRDPTRDGFKRKIARSSIEDRKNNGPSIMPAGLVNGLASRDQFLDLIRYLREIADGGQVRALALRPDPARALGLVLPDYESKIDHAAMIAELGPDNLARGEAIYRRVCANCHGTKDKLGSMPTSLRFATGRFKNGSDPLSLYRTLTTGFGQMPPQTWMVPSQKYDVIHYVRETFLKSENPTQYVAVDQPYLARLPKGTTRGPEPSKIEAWSAMDYGPALSATYEVGDDGTNFAFKGIATRLDPGPGGVSRGGKFSVFEHDTMRLAAAWTGPGFIDWKGINFDGEHGIHPRVVGQIEIANPDGPGWANPATGSFDDPRPPDRDGRRHGPLPRNWAHFRGQYRYGEALILSYTVGNTEILERPGLAAALPMPVFTRAFTLGPRDRDLILQVARGPKGARPILDATGRTAFLGLEQSRSAKSAAPVPVRGDRSTHVESKQQSKLTHDETGRPGAASPPDERGILAAIDPPVAGATWSSTPLGDLRLKIPAGSNAINFTLSVTRVPEDRAGMAISAALAPPVPVDLTALTRGGPALWPDVLKTPILPGRDEGPFAVDVFGLPDANPWLAQTRLTGFDFLDGGRSAAVCTWDGDVWLVNGLDARSGELAWRRIAAGLFQPLGLKVHGGAIHVSCRDQIVILRDKNGDGETDFYENFNSDHQVTEHFHEFAMDLQTDPDGNFYYTKAARHGKTAVVPQHGTLLRVNKAGATTEILATGFRAPNGVCVNGDGTFFLTDQEGFWIPKNRVNHVKIGGFYGNMWGYHNVADSSDDAMEPAVCWITNAFDRSPSQILRVTGLAWKPLEGMLLNLSYGNGKIFVVPYETVDGVDQGGMCALPIPGLPTGVMRGRFNPIDGQLYACGMFAWAGDQTAPGGFYRIRATGKPMFLPIGLHATRSGIKITFTDALDPRAVADASGYEVRTWSLRRSQNYGSAHHNERTLPVKAAVLEPDGRTLSLAIPGIEPTWCMEIRYQVAGAAGQPVTGVIDNTINRLPNR
jgi:putative heme-binding domain-containing protein